MLNSLRYSCTFNLKQNDSHSMFCRVNCFWLSSISDKYIWPDSVAKRFQNRSILLEYTKRPKSSELPGAPPPGAHSELLSPRFARYAPTFLNWSTQEKKEKEKKEKVPRALQESFNSNFSNAVRGRVNNSLQLSLFSSHGCIYTKVAISTSSMNLCLSCPVTWTVLHTWLHYCISIKTMHFDHCQ